VLLTTLWFLVIITVMVGFFAVWTQRAIDLTVNAQQSRQRHIDIYNTKSALIYLLTTQPFTTAGLTTNPAILKKNDDTLFFTPLGNEINVDNKSYQGQGNAYFSLQDEAGLLNLNLLSLDDTSKITERQFYRLLSVLGVNEKYHAILLARLRDYVDPDNNHRLNGAEINHYEQVNLSPPTNQPLLSPLECIKVLGWEELDELWKNMRWTQLTTTSLSGHININSAPLEILKTIDYINDEAAQRIIETRKIYPILGMEKLSEVTGIALQSQAIDIFDLGLRVFPSRFMRLSLWHKEANKIQQITIELTPKDDGGKPWYITSHYDYPLHFLKNIADNAPISLQLLVFNSTL